MEIAVKYIVGIILVFVHCLMRADSLEKDAKANGKQLPFTEYLKTDWKSIYISFLLVPVWGIILPEFSVKYPKLAGWEITSFGAIGFLGSYIIQTFGSVAKKRIREFAGEQKDFAEFGKQVQAERDAKKE